MGKLDPSASEPLYGFIPRNVKGENVRKALVCFSWTFESLSELTDLQDHELNPFTKVRHTPQYKKILEARKKLPVFAQMDEFLKMVRVVVLAHLRKA